MDSLKSGRLCRNLVVSNEIYRLDSNTLELIKINIIQYKSFWLKWNHVDWNQLDLIKINWISLTSIGFNKQLQDLIEIIFYLHLLLLRQKERSNKIYLPFIKYFLAIHPSLEHSSPRKPKALHKFRIAVHMIVAITRMKNSNIQGNSL